MMERTREKHGSFIRVAASDAVTVSACLLARRSHRCRNDYMSFSVLAHTQPTHVYARDGRAAVAGVAAAVWAGWHPINQHVHVRRLVVVRRCPYPPSSRARASAAASVFGCCVHVCGRLCVIVGLKRELARSLVRALPVWYL